MSEDGSDWTGAEGETNRSQTGINIDISLQFFQTNTLCLSFLHQTVVFAKFCKCFHFVY